jgi:hypothetical protein
MRQKLTSVLAKFYPKKLDLTPEGIFPLPDAENSTLGGIFYVPHL